MIINGFKEKQKKKGNTVDSDPLIRTMNQDILSLKKEGDKKTFPPDGLPIVESSREINLRNKEEVEKRKKEVQRKAKEEAERQRKLKEEADKKAKEEAERQRKLKEEADKKAKEEAERQKKLKEKAERKAERIRKIKEMKLRLINNLPKMITVISIALLVMGIGAFFYWWNYIREVPVILTHFECQNEQCIEIEGEGENECKINGDCEPKLPEIKISSDNIETIELELEKADTFLDRLEAILNTEQNKGEFKVILLKLIENKKTRYADFDSFVSISRLSIPEGIRETVNKSNISGNSYNLFSYGDGEKNRIGLIIDMEESDKFLGELKNWENTIINDIKPILFKDALSDVATEEFQDNIYKEIPLRYINIPTPDLSVDYAIINKKLIIATSKESMFAIIDSLISINE